MSPPVVFRLKRDLRAALAGPRHEGQTVALVPTMGFLHEGHLSLIEAARKGADIVVMSLFVNPTQFGESEDLEAYPSDEDRDLRLAGEAGADIVYAPTQADVYPLGFSTFVEVEGLTDVLCGDPSRRGAGHFRGVTTVVAKLLLTVGPDFAYFGQKDAQQAVVVRRMVRDLDFPVKVVVMPTVREHDGLAMSSRNAYLTDEERERAPALSRALAAVAHAAKVGIPLDQALANAQAVLAEAGVAPEYLEARHADDLSPADEFNGRPVLVAVAAQVGRARLIDNLLVAGADQPSAD